MAQRGRPKQGAEGLSDAAMTGMITDRDIALARERIRQMGVEDRMRLLLAFVDRDLGQLSTGEWLTLGAELGAFVMESATEAPARTSFTFHLGPPSLRQAQTELRAVSDALVAHKTVEIPSREVLVWTTPPSDAPDEVLGRIVLRRVLKASGLVPVLLVAFRDLIEQVAQLGRLRSCLECGGLFVSTVRQLRHPACAKTQRVRDRQDVRAKQRKTVKKGA